MISGGCKKDPVAPVNEVDLPELTTAEVTEITQTTAVCGGTVIADGGGAVTARGVCWSTQETPTIEDNKTSDGEGTGEFVSQINELTASTTYYVRAYATNSAGTAYGDEVSFTTEDAIPEDVFVDERDGNQYRFVTIGNQVWMAENLKYLPSVSGPASGSDSNPYYYVYGFLGTDVEQAMNTKNYETYGVLYNWPAAMGGESSSDQNPSGVQGVCPVGWHLPSNVEVQQLLSFLGGNVIAGGKLKEAGNLEDGTGHWYEPNAGATDEFDFTGLPGGQRNAYAEFDYVHSNFYFWTATEYQGEYAMSLSLYYFYAAAYNFEGSKSLAMSVRCIRN